MVFSNLGSLEAFAAKPFDREAEVQQHDVVSAISATSTNSQRKRRPEP
jgi:hypothetical protein